MTTVNGQSLLTLIEDEALLAAGSPVVTLLTALSAAAGDPAKEFAAWIQFQGNLVPALLTFNSAMQGQLLGALQAKFVALLAKAQTATVTPPVG